MNHKKANSPLDVFLEANQIVEAKAQHLESALQASMGSFQSKVESQATAKRSTQKKSESRKQAA